MKRKITFISTFTKLLGIIVLTLMISNAMLAQQWVDTVYQVEVHKDIIYGTAVNFAGKTDSLKLDVYLPANDTVPSCGRPVFVGIHGGGWYAGNKGEGIAASMARDFAKRGFVGVSINYRLGLFNTHQNIHCNIPGWDCWNMADTAEWYRANYRGIIDAQAALVFLAANAEEFNLNPENVFIAGESAGGFIAMGIGFIDDEEEIIHSLIDSLAPVRPPNEIYQTCIHTAHPSISIQNIDTLRPALEDFLTNPSSLPYKIKGVGNFYGGVFHNIFKNHDENQPVLYMFHQPCDLIVPYSYGKILSEFSTCLQQFPANCAPIISRPYIYGSHGIKNLIDQLEQEGIPTVNYQFSFTNNNYNCLQQLDPSMACHAVDNYWTRTKEMAVYFSSQIDTCASVSINDDHIWVEDFKIWPNPANNKIQITCSTARTPADIVIYDISGRMSLQSSGMDLIRLLMFQNFRQAYMLFKSLMAKHVI